MKIFYRVLALMFAVLALGAAACGVYLTLDNIGAEPVLVQAPEEARQRALALMDALCEGDYDSISDQLYGRPDLGLNRDPADAVGVLLWDALAESRTYSVLRDCYATDNGIAMDVVVEGLDLDSVLGGLRQRAQALLEQRVAQAENTDEIYAEGGEYREEFVMDVLKDATAEALEQEGKQVRWELTLRFVYDEGRWWIRPDEALLTAISGGTNK